MDLLTQDWFILQDPTAPGEHIVMESVGLKLSPMWTSQLEAQLFAGSSPAAQGMLVQNLNSPILKESYLLALGILGVQRVVVGYKIGMPSAQGMEVETSLRLIRQQIKPNGLN